MSPLSHESGRTDREDETRTAAHADPGAEYLAREAYLDPAVPATYEQVRFSGAMGKFRNAREQRGVGAIIDMLPGNLAILDCPCGIGRWWDRLATRARSIHGVDVSPAMLEAAEQRIPRIGVPVELSQGDAESLQFGDGSFDAVFSHALTKHLPIAAQHRALSEFARVSSDWVVCSFSVFGRLTYEFWRRRHFADSYPLLPEQLRDIASDVGLVQIADRRCTTPIGVEHSVLFRKAR
jgi:hypothetical protein